MRIMLVHSYYFPEVYGGAEFSVKKLAETLQARGNIVRVLCSGDENIIEKIDGIEVQRLKLKNFYRANTVSEAPRWKRLLSHFISIWNLGNYRILDNAIKEFKPDVIHTNCLYEISPIVWKAAKRNSARLVHTIRDYHLMCPLVAMSCKYTGGERCDNPQIGCRVHRYWNRIHSAYVDCVTAPSQCTLNVLVNDGFFRKSGKVVVPNAIDFDIQKAKDSLEHRKENLQGREKIVFVYLGGLTEQKGIRWMIEAFQELSVDDRAELVIAGKGLLENEVRAATANNSRIRYAGFLSEDQVSSLLAESDVLICPSLWEEPFGRVVLDAYKSGMPVISSDRGALPELVKDGKTGNVVKAGGVEMLKQAMLGFVQDHSKITELGEAAINELDKYSLVTQAAAFERIYAER